MLTLTPGSSCDVCAEEYGPHCPPHSIPCGHVLCANCCTTIAEKTSPRLSPACPFCREHFTSDSVRLIRMDFNTSGWSTPRRMPDIEANPPDFVSDAWSKRLMMAEGCSRSRQDARRLEAKVAKVAAKKCSVEEVTTLHKELQEWLTHEAKPDETSSLTLSAALLRAILMNHVAHSEASKFAKNVEANLKAKLDDFEIMTNKLDSELRRQRLQYSQKAQECQNLRQELTRHKIVSTTVPVSPLPSVESRHRSPSPPPLPTTYNSTSSTPSRFGHMRTSSMFSSSSAAAAAGLARSQTPGPISTMRSQTPAPPRSQTPGPQRSSSINMGRNELSPTRSQTPALPSRAGATTPTPTRHLSMSMASTPLRTRTPAPPQAAPRARRLSHPSPPKMAARTLSEEKHDAQAQHQRWLPSYSNTDDREAREAKAKFVSSRSPSRASNYPYHRRVVEEEDD
ncbi:hypothetical protein FB45DRAFT_139103 [Roridomyces roridus]|uniref:RING-type domain-containing protein n=1 Tax=Roridomyces roridus TaxID=1738132 RepID=A0AAD7FHY4_9AGAR|nr:hypothetical protein FB45DRAFT_139103 [Roridomyces roridus]